MKVLSDLCVKKRKQISSWREIKDRSQVAFSPMHDTCQ